jgi:uncharacterized protein (TIGR02246 family)
MTTIDAGRIVSDLVGELERAWNAGDGAAFGRPFADDADFVNIRGEHVRTRAVIANGHQGIFNTITRAARSATTSAMRGRLRRTCSWPM